MQILTLITNLPQEQITPKLLKNAAELMSQLFDVCEEDILVSIKANVPMAWGIQPGVFALGTVQSSHPIEAEDSKQLAPAVFDFFERHIGIPQNRMYLGFITLNPDNVAFDGQLYSAILEE